MLSRKSCGMGVTEIHQQRKKEKVMVRVRYFKLKFYKWNSSGYSKDQGVMDVGIKG